MPKMVTRTLAAVAAIVAAQCVAGYQAFAAEEPKTPEQEEMDRLKAETARYKEEAERYKEEKNAITERAARDKARIDALGLPSFDGKTVLNGTNAGAMEANMLAMYALQAAAKLISDVAPTEEKKFVVLAGNEAVDLNQVHMMTAQLDGIDLQFTAAIGSAGTQRSSFLPVSPTTLIAAATAIGKMLQSETTVTAVDLASVSERALANAVAGKIGERAFLPSALIGRITTANNLLARLEKLSNRRQEAAAMLAAQQAPNTPKAVALAAVIKRFDDFNTKVTTPDDKGIVPIVRAAQLNQLFEGKPAVLRVYVDRAGGTFVNTKNINTLFGADPLRVTGGLIASYTLTKPDTGGVVSSNIYVCRTALNRLREIHDANWKGSGGKSKALCTPMA